MPKIKTRKAVTKRLRMTKKGKFKRARACKGHILTKKARKRKRGLRKAALVSKTQARTMKKLMPYA